MLKELKEKLLGHWKPTEQPTQSVRILWPRSKIEILTNCSLCIKSESFFASSLSCLSVVKFKKYNQDKTLIFSACPSLLRSKRLFNSLFLEQSILFEGFLRRLTMLPDRFHCQVIFSSHSVLISLLFIFQSLFHQRWISVSLNSAFSNLPSWQRDSLARNLFCYMWFYIEHDFMLLQWPRRRSKPVEPECGSVDGCSQYKGWARCSASGGLPPLRRGETTCWLTDASLSATGRPHL